VTVPSLTLQSETGRLRRVLLKHPARAVESQAAVDDEWKRLHWLERPDYGRMCEEADRLRELLGGYGVQLLELPEASGTGLDSIYVRDAALVTDRGVVLGRMGKAARRGEPEALASFVRDRDFEVLGRIEGEGWLEGGDCLWLDRTTLAVGRGYRTNGEGICQLRALLEPEVTVLEVSLPHFRGPGDVFHLMSMVSPVAPDIAVVYSPTMPVPFREHLLERGWRLVEVPEDEFDVLGSNVLALAPSVALVCRGAPRTRERLREAGVEVVEFDAAELCVKGSGGPTCLTRTLEREEPGD